MVVPTKVIPYNQLQLGPPILQLGKLRLIEEMCQAQGSLAEAVTKAPRKEKKKRWRDCWAHGNMQTQHSLFENVLRISGDFPAVQRLRSHPATQGTLVRSLVGELGSHMPRSN